MIDPKRITPETDRSGRRPRTEYRAEYDGQLIGYYKSYIEAEKVLDAYALELIVEGLLHTAKARDGGPA